MDRRSFLRVAAAAGTGGVAGCYRSGTPSPESTPTADGSPTFTPPQTPSGTDTADGADVSVDVTPGAEVSGIVDGVTAGESLVFPSGRFTWSDEVRVAVDDWELRCQDDTVFEVPPGTGDGEGGILLGTHDRNRVSDNFRLENLTFTSPGRAAPGLDLAVRNTASVHGLHYEMNGPLSNRWQENGLQAFVQNAEGRLLITDYRQFNNGDLGAYGYGDSRIGIWVGRRNEGTVHLRNPVLQGFPNNACYVSRQPGSVVVDGGLLLNNNVSAVRVSGGVEVHDTTICIDVDRYLDGPGTLEAPAHNTRGLWGDNRQAGTDGGLVEGVSCVLESYQRCSGLATILENPQMSVRDCQFLLNQDIAGIHADDGEIRVVDCAFDGDSINSTAGVGTITGPGGHIASNIAPGDVPLQGRNSEFDWSRTHRETPGRPSVL